MPQNLTDEKPTLVQVMTWCCQATSHRLNQCWLRPVSPYGVTRPQWIKWFYPCPSQLKHNVMLYMFCLSILLSLCSSLIHISHRHWLCHEYLLLIIARLWVFLYIVKALEFNSLWPSDTIWWQRSGSTLVQVMACCLTAPSYYLNHCWLIISKVQWHSPEGNFTSDTSAMNP